MPETNVIDFELAAQRQRERQGGRAVSGGHGQAWRSRHREGIDGMVTTQQVKTSPAEILPFVPARSRLPAKLD